MVSVTDDRPPRPDPIGVEPDAVPDTLTERDAWVCWRYEWSDDRDEWTKVPVDVDTSGFAKSTDPDTWTSFPTALAYHERAGTDTDGVGFVAHEGDTVLGLDLDDCRDPETGDLEAWAEDVLDDVPTYAEVSPSGTGLRLFGLGFVPDGGNRGDINDADGHLEMYDNGRYLTVTGHHVDGSPEDIEQVNDEVQAVHSAHIADSPDSDADDEQTSLEDTADTDGNDGAGNDLSDQEIISKATAAENGDKFRRLWNGRTSDYPSHSEADLALCSLLAFWTGGDHRQMDRLFRQSGLSRDKWTEREDYRKRTIKKAVRAQSEFYSGDQYDDTDRPSQPTPQVPDTDPATADGGTQTQAGGGDQPDQTAAEADDDTADEGDRAGYTLSPKELVAVAGEDPEDTDVADLDDRQRAACVWAMVKQHDSLHVRVKKDTDELWSYHDGIWKPNGERVLREAARRGVGPMNYGENVLSELKSQVLADPVVSLSPDRFGVAEGKIAVENGLLDIQSAADGAGDDAIRDLEPDDYALTRLPVRYDPEANADRWRDLVDEWAEDGRTDMLQEYVGYCLHAGGLPIHRALLLVGSGRNGKGTFLHVVRELLGEDNTSSIELQTLANEKDALAEFYGSLANIDDDLSSRSLGQGLGMFKKLVGGDPVRARRLYEDGFQFTPTGKHLYAANEVPDVDVPDEDEAFWSRWIIVEFPKFYPPSQRDPGLRDELTEPEVLSGVLNWAIEGWARLREQQEFTSELAEGFRKRQRWQEWGDTIDKFIAECVGIVDDTESVASSEVHARYVAWCEQQGEQAENQRALTQQLKNQGAGYSRGLRIDGKKARGFQHIEFTEDAPDPQQQRDGGQERLG